MSLGSFICLKKKTSCPNYLIKKVKRQNVFSGDEPKTNLKEQVTKATIKIKGRTPTLISTCIMFFVYILQSFKDKGLYAGFTGDLRKRIKEHNAGLNKSTKYRRPLNLVYYEAYKSAQDAKKREEMLKLYGRAFGGLKRRIRHSLNSDLDLFEC